MHHAAGHTHEAAPETRGSTIRWAKYYDRFVQLLTFGRENALRAETIRIAEIQRGATVLDVGCGTGSLTLLAKAATGTQGRVYGIDAAPEMIQVARQKAARQQREVNFQVGLIEALQFPDATFDVVLSSLMFHHLPDDLKRSGLAEIYRVLKPSGRLVIVDMKGSSGFIQHLSLAGLVHHRLTKGVQQLPPMLTEAGFTAIQTGNMPMMQVGYICGQRSG